MKRLLTSLMIVIMALISGFSIAAPPTYAETFHKSDADWKKSLTAEQYYILRKHGTERAFSGQYDHFYKNGVYTCAGCGQKLFGSQAKFNSHTGWPSFYQPIGKQAVGETKDATLGMVRTEVHCARCGGHLGHVFNDGPKPTGLRYCMNSTALKFTPTATKITPVKPVVR